MQDELFAVARRREKTGEPPATADGLPYQPLCHRTERHRLHGGPHIPQLACLGDLRLVFESKIEGGQPGGGVADGVGFDDAGGQDDLVTHSARTRTG